MVAERTAHDWFDEAARCYLERHQACAWCGGAHRVFQLRREHQTIYYCHGCDFRVEHHHATDDYRMVPGEAAAPTRPTMLEFEI